MITLQSGHRYHNLQGQGWLDIERADRWYVVIDHHGDRFVPTESNIDGLDVASAEPLTDALDYPSRFGPGWQLGRERLDPGCLRLDMLNRYVNPCADVAPVPQPGQLELF